jgi:hypothetical protein
MAGTVQSGAAFLAPVWGRLADRMTGIGLCLSTQWVSLYLQLEGSELRRFQNPLDLQVEQTNKPNNRTVIIPQGVDWLTTTQQWRAYFKFLSTVGGAHAGLAPLQACLPLASSLSTARIAHAGLVFLQPCCTAAELGLRAVQMRHTGLADTWHFAWHSAAEQHCCTVMQ